MAVKVRERNGQHWVFVNYNRQRRAKQVGPGKEGKKLADRLAKEWNAALVLGDLDKVFPKAEALKPVALPTLREAIPRWLEEQEQAGNVRGATRPAYMSAAKTWIFPAIGDIPAEAVTREQIGAIITDIKKAGRSRAAVGHVVKCLSGFYRHLVETKQIAASPVYNLRYFVRNMPKRKEIVLFTKDEIPLLLQAAKETDSRLYPVIAMGLDTGGRWGEIAALMKDDIDLKRRQVIISKSWSRNTRKMGPTKTGKTRQVPLPKSLIAILREWFEVRAAEGWGDRSLLFPGPDGKHMVSWGERWKQLLKRAGLKHRPFKATRNCFASYKLLAGARPENVQRWLGHSTLSMTIDTYRQFIPVPEADAADIEKGSLTC